MQKQEQFEVRDLRKKDKFVIDDEYLNGYARICGIYATGVYVSLCRHADKEQKCWPSIRKISAELNISQVMVQKALKILERHRIIMRKQMGKGLNNRYILIDKSLWVRVSPDSTLLSTSVSPSNTPNGAESVSPHDTGCITTDKSVYHHRQVHSKETHKGNTNKDGANSRARTHNLQELTNPYRQRYGDAMIDKFLLYWTQKNDNGKKELWQMQQVFDVPKRLATWAGREWNSDKKQAGVVVLHDGTQAVMRGGRWVDVRDPTVVIDVGYYPELSKH